jgi:hypothetical protein
MAGVADGAVAGVAGMGDGTVAGMAVVGTVNQLRFQV